MTKSITLIYGSSGAGKTTLMGSITDVPELMPCLFISAERRIKVIQDKSYVVTDPLKDYSKDKLTVFFMDNLTELQSALNGVKSQKDSPYKSIVIDSITTINQYDLKGSGRFTGKLNFGAHKKSEYADWNRVGDNLHHFMEFLKSFQQEIFITALPRFIESDIFGTEVICPMVYPNHGPETLMSHCDNVGYLKFKTLTHGVKRILTFNQDGVVRAKHTFGKDFKDDFENPVMSDIYEKIKC